MCESWRFSRKYVFHVVVDQRYRPCIAHPNHCHRAIWPARLRLLSLKQSLGRLLLPPRHALHVGQLVRDAVVAVDAGLLGREQEALMRNPGARRLLGDIHRVGRVAIAAFE